MLLKDVVPSISPSYFEQLLQKNGYEVIEVDTAAFPLWSYRRIGESINSDTVFDSPQRAAKKGCQQLGLIDS